MSLLDALQLSLIILIGLCLGSFGSMLLYRLPRNQSFLGRSKCPHCGSTLRWYDLLPIVSFVLLRGKCRYCGKPIAWRYPLLELISALVLLLLYLNLNPSLWVPFLFLLLASYSLILIAFYDFETQNIPDVFITVLFLSALCYQAIMSLYGNELTMRHAFMGALIPLAFFGTLWLLGREKWIGSGDVLLGTSMGLLLGLERSVLAIFLAYILGANVAVFLLVKGRVKSGSTMAFGPFLSAGALIALLIEQDFLLKYQELFLGF